MADLDFEKFKFNSLVRSATERQLTIIGEAVNALSVETKAKYTSIDWRGIKGFRNIIVHEYFGVSVRMVWVVVVKELPVLKEVVQQIIADCNDQSRTATF
ncbi:HepT-like ribonuclease domain-containing protein [Telluribacter sp. SYSU D00476]|uniref:HepT-like ribonuclease domain-containing protein n=1 Tax=Telluribacter sp. SYSU D00476 TaxID=2811430 RepID=UPI001FF3585F